ncbi:MAG: hypothetical protein FD153_388 [Rhodospirillaceae bacterium]|nr:MAG: hypothetical protein FD153_388 [Rhodospirillaceae bacterium]
MLFQAEGLHAPPSNPLLTDPVPKETPSSWEKDPLPWTEDSRPLGIGSGFPEVSIFRMILPFDQSGLHVNDRASLHVSAQDDVGQFGQAAERLDTSHEIEHIHRQKAGQSFPGRLALGQRHRY